MNVQTKNYEFTHKRRLKPERHSAKPDNIMSNSVGLCREDNTRGYNVNFSGSAPGKSEAAAKTFMDRFMNSKAIENCLRSRGFNWLVKFTGFHNVAAAALIGLFLAGCLRPAITASLPGKKDWEDKMYAAGHSMASGIIGFAFSTLVTTPIDSGIKYIFDDAKKISKADYDNLTSGELAEYIRKNNITPEDIAAKMAISTKSKEDILAELQQPKKNLFFFNSKEKEFFKSEKLAEYVKANDGVIMPIRKINKGLTIVSDKTDAMNKLKHELFLEEQNILAEANKKTTMFTKAMQKTRKFFGLKELGKPQIKYTQRAHDLAKQMRELANHIDGINSTMHNISEWVIAIPRAMLTIALIPPILKYVFHVEKKNKAKAQAQAQAVTPAPLKQPEVSNLQNKNVVIKPKHMNEFVGGNK